MAMKRNRKTTWIFLLLALLLLTACSHTGGKPPLPEAAQDSYPFNQTAWENYLTTESVVYHRNGAILTSGQAGMTGSIRFAENRTATIKARTATPGWAMAAAWAIGRGGFMRSRPPRKIPGAWRC